ncbi:hypothetical protein FSARC_8012 [Fusarium sarcochroum]|uniref:Alpha/beta hydrolase fold-3 domain-containing protein n=1 Tax=Fusarium sarcochroum TaxID=1208366 RepID=A0A8H4TU71_9HYPO|nr:hypothetical protein FSARC_8012 [Fusarium sarcochroum]
MSSDKLPRPPVDVEFANVFDNSEFADLKLKSKKDVPNFRAGCAEWFRMTREVIQADQGISVEEKLIPGLHGDIPIVIVRRRADEAEGRSDKKPALLWLHGGAWF